MDIYPEDFDAAYSERIQQVRGLFNDTFVGESQYCLLGAVCGMALGLVLDLWLQLFSSIPGSFFLVGGAGAAVGCTGGFFADRNNQAKQRAEKVTPREINLIRKAETDPLGIEYLSLVSKIVSMQSFQDQDVEQSIRKAIRDLGSSIARLPGQPAADLLLDTQTFKKEAARLAGEADQENDPVVAASLQRQAVVQNLRAEAISQNSALARRNQVLRHEMIEQIRGLKTVVGATALGDSGGGYDLAILAENIQQIAVEARSLAEAKKELAAGLEAGKSGKNVVPELPQLHGLSRQ